MTRGLHYLKDDSGRAKLVRCFRIADGRYFSPVRGGKRSKNRGCCGVSTAGGATAVLLGGTVGSADPLFFAHMQGPLG